MSVLAQLLNAESCMQMVGNLSEANEPSKTKQRKKVKIAIRKRAIKLINKECSSFKKNARKKIVNVKNRLVCEDLSEFIKEYGKHNLFFYN